MKQNTTLDTIANVKILQSKNGYRFSIDALLLAAFVNLQQAHRRFPPQAGRPHTGGLAEESCGDVPKKIADLGAGSGIIGILLAKKYPSAKVDLIEIQNSLALLAEKNIRMNLLAQRIKTFNCNIKNISGNSSLFSPKSFDLAVSNPPFRRQKTGLISPTDEKAIARHEIKLSLKDIADASFYLLRSKGRLCIIYHPARLLELIDELRKKQLEPKRLRFVHSDINSEAKMVLVEAVKNGRPEMKIEKPLFIYQKNGSYTEELKKILHSKSRV